MTQIIPKTIGTRPRRIVCGVCSLGLLDGVVLFSSQKPGEPRQRYCAEHIDLAEAKRRLGRGPHTLDADVLAAFTRRIEAAQ